MSLCAGIEGVCVIVCWHRGSVCHCVLLCAGIEGVCVIVCWHRGSVWYCVLA